MSIAPCLISPKACNSTSFSYHDSPPKKLQEIHRAEQGRIRSSSFSAGTHTDVARKFCRYLGSRFCRDGGRRHAGIHTISIYAKYITTRAPYCQTPGSMQSFDTRFVLVPDWLISRFKYITGKCYFPKNCFPISFQSRLVIPLDACRH